MIKTVGDLIKELEKFPPDMEVTDYAFMEFEEIKIKTWTHDNYLYDIPDKDVVCVC